MSRRVRNWCDICRDLEPDIRCTNEGCPKKYHEACLRNVGLWQPGDENRATYICPDCRESSTNESFCYICKKELILANDKRRKRKGKQQAASQSPPSEAKTADEGEETEPEEADDDDDDDDIDDGKDGDDESDQADDEADDKEDDSSDKGVATRQKGRQRASKSAQSKQENADNPSRRDAAADNTSAEEDAEQVERPRRSARQAAARNEEAGKKPDSSGAASGGDSGGGHKERRLKKVDVSNQDDFVLCDGCVKSAHLRCLGLSQMELNDDLWFCTECDPNSVAATAMAKSAAERKAAAMKHSSSNAATKTRLGNVDICYVCQKGGKLLGCDFCEQSFHPRCIDAEFLEFEKPPEDPSATVQGAEGGDLLALSSQGDVPVSMLEKWRCPICKGEDPLKNMGHKRMSRTAMLKLSREWQTCIKQTHRQCRQNRDRFLWSCRKALIPFVTPKTLAKLRKSVGAPEVEPHKRRRGSRRAVGDESDETEGDGDTTRADEERQSLQAYSEAIKIAEEKNQSILKEGVVLKGYQTVGVGWLLNAFQHKAGAILADEMGLGKTIQCLAFLSSLKCMGITGPHLIVVPLSTVGNWAREIRRFIPHMRFVKICGSRFERDHIVADPTASQGLYDLYITTYETVVTEESFFCDSISWQCLILDEAHRIKNESGRIRHSLDRVSANMRTLLTGTPLQNNVKELFTLLNFLFPDILKDSGTFEQVFAKQETNSQGGLANEVVDESAVQAVSSLLSKMMLRRTKDLVVKLPRKLEHDVWLPLSPVSAFWYSKLLQVSEAESAFQQLSVKKLLGTVVKMRICCCHPRGLVTRDTQLRKFKEVFQGLGPVEEQAIEKAANDLLTLAGEEHIKTSSKLLALDKLLCHLHVQNLEVSESYKRDFVQNCKDLYIQAHPLEPLTATSKQGTTKPAAKASAASVKAASAKPEKVKQETTEIPENETQTTAAVQPLASDSGTAELQSSQVDMPLLSSSADVGTSQNADQETIPNSQEVTKSKPLTARQQAERVRRERLAAMAAQQAKLDAELEALENEVLHRITSSAQNPDLFREFMADAEVADTQTTATFQGDGNGDGGVDDNDTVPESPTVPSPSLDEAPSPVVDLTNSATSFEEENHENEKGSKQSLNNPEQAEQDAMHDQATEARTEPDQSETPETKTTSKQLFPHKVLVFTQFQLVLDELETYCKFRGFRYLRLDGSTNKMIRELDIREFNSLSSTHLVYLICTRAGGVGINLVTANHVILYDEDWNPFIDLQAIDRAHRIGQRRDVHVWKLITEWTVEERMAFRRRQKLKLDRLLIHANTANTGDVETIEEADEIDGSGDRFSMDEIRKLLTHGRSAINKAYTENDQSLLTESLEEMIARPRKPLPVVEEKEIEAEAALEDDIDMAEKSGEPRVSLAEALDPEERAECLVGTVTAGAASRTSTDEPGDNDTELQDLEVEEKRSRRLRKRVPLVYQSLPQLEQKVKQERKLVHDKKCFKCGSGVNPNDEQADTLIACHRCPKVYHMSSCLNMEEVPRRTWTCPWHECCLCFRKGSQAGGLLIHCAECPTAFCFDCFPPEYRRYTPPATYYAELTRRGYPVNQDKLVLFLCSRCKALKEQQRRRALSRQQLDAELKKRREANLKAKLDAQRTVTSDKAATTEKKSADAKREFLARKRVIDDSEREWSREIRANYERLFPEAFLEVLRQKRLKQSEGKKEQGKEEVTTSPVGPATEEANVNPTPALSTAPSAATKPTTTQKIVLAKMPSEFCKVCENCRLPGHEAHACPFPLETEKKNISQTVPLPAGTQEETTQQMEEEQVAEKIRHHSKRLIRSFCPKCGVSSRNHFRRHCEQLDPSEVEEYAERKAKILKFVEELKKVPQIETPPDMTISIATVESCRRVLQRQVDDIVANCLKAAGLEACVAPTVSQSRQAQIGSKHPLQGAKNRRRRKSDDMEDLEGLSGVETDDPNYSPRKKARAEGDEEPGDSNDIDSSAPDDRKRRRPMPNFVELAGGGAAAILNEEEEERALKAAAARISQDKWKDERDGDRRKQPRLEPLPDGVKEPAGMDRRYADNDVKRSSPTFSSVSARPHLPPISYSAGMPSIRPTGEPGLNSSRLPPSRWHGHPSQMLPTNRLPPQPIYGPPALWGPYGPRYTPGLIMPPMKWQWPSMAPLHGAYPPFGPPFGPPPGHMPK